ncbi:hypothetical protein AC579_656 [Pseudocercospora musae]|uniref:Heterokaryon incompatibility domain-containing protein n=1 Tax=Pseudocercospora musae TaxID=113226 RepID=A0A139I934_9PEZI|nr:hypothetical protein AC579_656 [Pseudocercospora musae]
MNTLPDPVPARVAPTYKQRKVSTGPGWRNRSDRDEKREITGRPVTDVHDKYQFQPLPPDCTRLLMVQPPEEHNDDHIEVILKIVTFADLGTARAPYEALSYCWGNEDADQSVFVLNDESQASTPYTQIYKPRKISITPNLHAALCHLRMSRRAVSLWIDALCMDQGKLDERQEQVSRMAEIYSKAHRVLVWLGDGDARTKSAIRLANDIVGANPDASTVGLYDVSRAKAWSDFGYLVRSSWFSRRWVIQELALAQEATVHCGNDEIHWENLRDAISIFMDHFDKVRDPFKREPQYETDYKDLTEPECLAARLLVDTINIIFRPHPTRSMPKSFDPVQSLEDLVSEPSAFLTSDGRDAIYPEEYISVCWLCGMGGRQDGRTRYHLPQLERKVRGLNFPELVTLPSWIRTTSNAPFANRNRPTRARYNADTLVGMPDKASGNNKARYSFQVDRPLASPFTHQSSESAATVQPVSDGENTSSPVLNTRKPYESGPNLVSAVPSGALRRSPRAPISLASPNKRQATADHGERAVPKRRRAETFAPAQRPVVSRPTLEERTKRSAYLSVDGVQVGTISWRTDPTTDGAQEAAW